MDCYDCCFSSPMPRALIDKDQHRWDDVHIAGSLCLSEGCKGFHMPRMLASRGMIALGPAQGREKLVIFWRSSPTINILCAE